MTTDNIAQLSAGAARLLLVLLLEGSDQTPDQLAAKAGLDSRRAYFRAKAQLKELGLLECHPAALALPEIGTPVPPSGTVVPQTGTPPVPQIGTSATQRHSPVPPTGTTREVPDEGDFLDGITGSWLALCSRADRLPADGEPTQRGSNWQARRRAQMEALQGAYRDLFAGQELHPAAAKDMLRLAHDSAECVYEAMEKAAARKPNSPTTYIQGILRKEAAQAPAPVTVSRPQDGELVLRELTDEDRRVSASLKRRLIASGYVLSEEDR